MFVKYCFCPFKKPFERNLLFLEFIPFFEDLKQLCFSETRDLDLDLEWGLKSDFDFDFNFKCFFLPLLSFLGLSV